MVIKYKIFILRVAEFVSASTCIYIEFIADLTVTFTEDNKLLGV